jgi:hypothetical protein
MRWPYLRNLPDLRPLVGNIEIECEENVQPSYNQIMDAIAPWSHHRLLQLAMTVCLQPCSTDELRERVEYMLTKLRECIDMLRGIEDLWDEEGYP